MEAKRSEGTRAVRLGLLLVLLGGAIACESPPVECSVGEAGCPCASAGQCNDGSICTDGICEAPREVVLRVSAPEARACEVLLLDGQARVADVRFEGSTVGTHVREAPRTAVTFTSTEAAPLGSSAVRLLLVGEGEPVRVGGSSCFDAAGARLAGAAITVEG